MPSGARPLPCRAQPRAKRRASCCAASPRRPTRPRSRAGANCPATASNSPCAGCRARIESRLHLPRLRGRSRAKRTHRVRGGGPPPPPPPLGGGGGDAEFLLRGRLGFVFRRVPATRLLRLAR